MLPPAIETGAFVLTAFCSLPARPTASCPVSAFWIPSWKPPAPPHPARQELLPPTVWPSPWPWFVEAVLPTFVLAVELAACDALVGPELTSPPAIDTGALPFTAFWLLAATPNAPCSVSAFWIPSWKPPAPPHPARQELLPPSVCPSDWPWFVEALLPTFVSAEELAACAAELGPEFTSPPAIETGALPFTAFWSLWEIPAAVCSVAAFWIPSWAPPAPPHPARQELLPPTVWPSSCPWFVDAVLPTFVSAEELAACAAELGPELTSPPAIETGALVLTAFWSLWEAPAASCSVSAFWIPSWKPPAPPQPARQELLPPTVWPSPWPWFVEALLPTFVLAVGLAAWDALLGPELTSPPAIETGTFALTAFWWLSAEPRAPCSVSAFCTPSWAPPAPPQPARQEPFPPIVWD